MKQKNNIYLLLLFCLNAILYPNVALSQEFPYEHIDLITDRSVYICGEPIQFSGILSLNQENEVLSDVVYVELITALGQKVSQLKIKIENNQFEGQLTIPKDALSSYYYIRAYTKWMRNGSPYEYAYLRLKLINPYNPEVLEIPDSLLLTKSEAERSESYTKPSFFTIKNEYKKGEKIILKDDANSQQFFELASLSIIPLQTFSVYESTYSSINYDSVTYIPETRGVTLSGKILDKKTKLPIPYYKVGIHIENEMDFIEVLANKEGQFFFSLPNRYGNRDVLIIPSSLRGNDVELLVDQDYCTKNIYFKIPPFSISEDEKSRLIQMTQTLQISKLIGDNYRLKNDSTEQHPFYGHPYKTLDFDAFVELDSMSQYFTDLPSYLKVKKHKGKRELFVVNPDRELNYEPLILMDWVPIDDPEKVLKLDPRRIKKFEVIVEPYIHGSIIYGGIISFYSRKNDFSGFEFPPSAMYVNFDFYSANSNPKRLPSQEKAKLTNTPTWIPSLDYDQIQEKITLEAPSISGKYILLIQTINKEGERVNYKQSFSVN